MLNFYPRSPYGERLAGPSGPAFLYNFYPRSPYGERPPVRDIIQWEGIFLSTLSLRRATFDTVQIVVVIVFLSTLSLRRATIDRNIANGERKFLSTLSLRRATRRTYQQDARREFLSTLSLRRATQILDDMSGVTGHFYPRSPYGERH